MPIGASFLLEHGWNKHRWFKSISSILRQLCAVAKFFEPFLEWPVVILGTGFLNKASSGIGSPYHQPVSEAVEGTLIKSR
jgi:hypothetical protein